MIAEDFARELVSAPSVYVLIAKDHAKDKLRAEEREREEPPAHGDDLVTSG